MTDIEPSSPPTLQELNHLVVSKLVRGQSEASVIALLTSRGWPVISARQYVANAARLSDEYRAIAQARKSCVRRNSLARSLLWVVSGIVVVLLARDATSVTDTMTGIYFCIALFGFLLLLTGLANWWRRHK